MNKNINVVQVDIALVDLFDKVRGLGFVLEQFNPDSILKHPTRLKGVGLILSETAQEIWRLHELLIGDLSEEQWKMGRYNGGKS